MPNVYLDTTFFTGLLENQEGREQTCKDILSFEKEQSSTLFTSVLTVNEFCHKYYNSYHDDDDCESRVTEAIRMVASIASLYALSEEVNRRAARILSAWYRANGAASPKLPEAKFLRWDALHLATADQIKAVRAYTWDHHWENFS